MTVRLLAKKTRKFSCYESLRMVLTRSGVSEPGATAGLLLDVFSADGGKIYAQSVVARGLCKVGGFKEWRDSLVKLGWINFDYNQARADKDFVKHKPGPRLLNYINKEKNASREIATIDELEAIEEKIKTKADILDVATKAELEEVKDRVAKIETSMTEIYEAFGLGETDPTEFQKLRNFQQEISKKEHH